jgi:hypothetical protein
MSRGPNGAWQAFNCDFFYCDDWGKPALAFAFEPFHGFFLQGLVVTESNAGCSAAAAADAFFCVHIDGALLVKNGVHGTDRLGIA